jgi:hypothetical protein
MLAQIHANWIFYRRNRLLWVIGIFFLISMGISIIPALFFSTSQQKLNILLMLVQELLWFVEILVVAMAILNFFYQKRNRCFKMIVTKPFSPELWLFSNFFSALLVAVVLYLVVGVICVGLFLFWHIPLQLGALYLGMNCFCSLLIDLSVMMGLCAILHPFLAVLLYLTMFNERIFYQLTILMSAGLQDAEVGVSRFLYASGKYLFSVIYYLLPSRDLFSERTEIIAASLRLAPGDTAHFVLMGIYGLVLFLGCLSFTSWVLRRRNAA